MSQSLNYGTILVVAILTATLLFLVNHVYFSPASESFEKLPSRPATKRLTSAVLQPIVPFATLPPPAILVPPLKQRQQEGQELQEQQDVQRQQRQQRKHKQHQQQEQQEGPQKKQTQHQQRPVAATSIPAAFPALSPVPPTSLHTSSLAVSAPSPGQCPTSVYEAYRQPDPLSGRRDAAWCQQMKAQHHVMLGRSWGSLPRDRQREWDKAKCNEQLAMGRLQSCEERWGWSYLSSWLRAPKALVTGQSTVRCGSDIKTSTLCKYSDVVVDFSKPRLGQERRIGSSGPGSSRRLASATSPRGPSRRSPDTSTWSSP